MSSTSFNALSKKTDHSDDVMLCQARFVDGGSKLSSVLEVFVQNELFDILKEELSRLNPDDLSYIDCSLCNGIAAYQSRCFGSF